MKLVNLLMQRQRRTELLDVSVGQITDAVALILDLKEETSGEGTG